MKTTLLLLLIWVCHQQCLTETIPFPSQEAKLKNVSEGLVETLKSTVVMLKDIELVYKQTADSILKGNEMKIKDKVGLYKSQILLYQTRQSTNVTSVISSCLKEGGYLDIASDLIIKQMNNCALITLMEVINMISNSINEAQAFMSLPSAIAKDIQSCGIGPECLPKIAADAFYESLETPSKVLVLAARVQQLSFQSVQSITGCALDAVAKIADLGGEIVQDVINCLQQAINL